MYLIKHTDCPKNNWSLGDAAPTLVRNEPWDELKDDLTAFSCPVCGQVIVIKEVEEE